LSPDDKILLWQYREYCRHHLKPRALVKVLSCVNWKDIECVKETYRLLNCWRELEPVDALEVRRESESRLRGQIALTTIIFMWA